MPGPIHLRAHLTVDELERRFRGAKDPKEPHERGWRLVSDRWLLAHGQTAMQIAWTPFQKPESKRESSSLNELDGYCR